MVEINNQRKAFLDMLAWSEGTDNGRQKTRNHGYDVIVGDYYWLLRSPSQTCHAKPKLKSTSAGRYQLLSRWWDAYRKQLGLKDFSPKSQDAGIAAWIRRVALYPMIDRDIRQAIDRCSNIWKLHRALVMVSSSMQADSLIAKFKEAGGTVREIDVWAKSPRLCLALVICIIVCLSWAVNHFCVITPLPTKPSATKMPENWRLANAAITDMQMRQRDVAALDAKYTKGVSWCQSWKWCSAWWCCRWSSWCTSKQSVSQCVKPPPPPAWIMQPPRLADTAERDYSPSERGWSLCKNNWKEPRSILMSSADRVAHIDGQYSVCEQYTRASSGV